MFKFSLTHSDVNCLTSTVSATTSIYNLQDQPYVTVVPTFEDYCNAKAFAYAGTLDGHVSYDVTYLPLDLTSISDICTVSITTPSLTDEV